MTIGDFNADGIPDLAIANGSAVSMFQGHGDGTFALVASTPQPTGYPVESMVVSDFNGDGAADIVTVNDDPGENLSVLLGSYAATATAESVTVPGTGTRHVFASKVGDTTHYGSTSPTTWSVQGSQ